MGAKTLKTETRAESLSLSLALHPKQIDKAKKKKKSISGVFECKTCNRQFQTFQALGGHSTSHLRPKIRFNGLDLVIGTKVRKPIKRHVCNFCGKEFMLGQALGGHMRLHRTELVEEELTQERPEIIMTAKSNQILAQDLINNAEQFEIDLNKSP